jgi:hypothetical protein
VKALTFAPGFDPDFFRYQVQALAPEILEATSKTGTTVESLDFPSLRKFRVLVAPPGTQKEVVGVLDRVTANLRSTQVALVRAKEDIRRLMATILGSAFSGELTRRWRIANEEEGPWKRVTVADVTRGNHFACESR